MNDKERSFVLEHIYNDRKVNVSVFDATDSLIETFNRGNQETSGNNEVSDSRRASLKDMRKQCLGENSPKLFSDSDGIYYVAFVDREEYLYLFGPMSVEAVSFSELMDYRKRHQITNPKFKIPVLGFAEIINMSSLVYYMITGNCVSEQDIFEANRFLKQSAVRVSSEEVMIYEISSATEEKRRLAYRDELKWAAEIENGTRTETKNLFQPENLEKLKMIGTLSNKNALKQYEYMVITSACLACRAAIRGGVDVYEAYALTDIYYQKASMCSSVMELLQLYAEIADEFSSRVRRAKESRMSDVVEHCKDYIARNRTRKFSLTLLAAELEKNPSYLSHIFSEQTGRTLQDYALSLRLEAGANLLKYSDRSVGEIAEYLHFSSQSYFGEYFKKQYGKTPAEYRKHYKIRDFKE